MNGRNKTLKVDSDTHFRIKMAAQRAGMKLESWVRLALLAKLKTK